MHGHKFTLRCTRCKLLYNYAQYGNKHELGFRYYPFQRGFVVASSPGSRHVLNVARREGREPGKIYHVRDVGVEATSTRRALAQ